METLGKLDYMCSAISQFFSPLVPEVLLRKMKWQAFEREAKGDFGLEPEVRGARRAVSSPNSLPSPFPFRGAWVPFEPTSGQSRHLAAGQVEK